MQHRQLTNEADGFSVDYSDGEGPKKDVCAELLTQLDLVGLRGLCCLEA
jgi:hypothetical protein